MCFVQSPKTPLQKSMDLLGKQLSLYSLSIIGVAPSPASSGHFCLWGLALPPQLSFQGSSCWWGGSRGRGSWTCSPSESGDCRHNTTFKRHNVDVMLVVTHRFGSGLPQSGCCCHPRGTPHRGDSHAGSRCDEDGEEKSHREEAAHRRNSG